jgi:uncharacterized membrane protein
LYCDISSFVNSLFSWHTSSLHRKNRYITIDVMQRMLTLVTIILLRWLVSFLSKTVLHFSICNIKNIYVNVCKVKQYIKPHKYEKGARPPGQWQLTATGKIWGDE